MLPAFSDPDGCVALTGLDRELVRIKLLRNHDRSLVMIEGSATPFV
jgi:hypothetical protein